MALRVVGDAFGLGGRASKKWLRVSLREIVWETRRRSYSPSASEIASRVRVSAIPERTSLVWKEGEESVGCVGAPAGAGLGEVLEAGEDVEVLSAGFGDQGGEVVDRRDVRDLVQAEEHGWPGGLVLLASW